MEPPLQDPYLEFLPIFPAVVCTHIRSYETHPHIVAAERARLAQETLRYWCETYDRNMPLFNTERPFYNIKGLMVLVERRLLLDCTTEGKLEIIEFSDAFVLSMGAYGQSIRANTMFRLNRTIDRF